MTTTALFVEYLVVGAQSAVWISLAACCFAGTQWIRGCATDVGNWGVLIAFVGVGIMYTSGIILERLSGAMLPIVRCIWVIDRLPWLKRCYVLARDHRTTLKRQQGRIAESLEYGLSRIRVVRAAVVNIVLVYFTAVLAIGTGAIHTTDTSRSVLWLGVACAVLLLGALAALAILLVSYAAALEDAVS